MYSGAFVSARHNRTGNAGWAVVTRVGCDSSSMRFALDCAALCAMKNSGVGSTDPNDFQFTWGVDCFDCTAEDVPNGLLSDDNLQFSSGHLAEELRNTSKMSCASTTPSPPKLSMELTDSAEESSERSLIWSASDGAIGGGEARHWLGEIDGETCCGCARGGVLADGF